MTRKRSPYLKSLPAFVVLVVYCVILGRSLWIQDSILGRYRELGQAAIEKSEFELARTYYERVAQVAKKSDPMDDLNLAIAAFKSGDSDAGQSLLDRLAPDDSFGFPRAHRLKAMQLVSKLMSASRVASSSVADNLTVDQSTWDLVRVHLSRSGQDDPVELADLWTAYYLAAGKPSEAIAQQIKASQFKPDRWLATAQLCIRLNDENQRKRASQQAELYFVSKVKDNPFDHSSRINLARVFIYDKRFEEADSIILQGLKIAGNDSSPAVLELRRAASEILLLQIDSVPGNSDTDLSSKHQLLVKAIELDANNPMAYQKMLAMFESGGSVENRKKLIKILEQQVATGKSIAMAHFTLGCANWVDGNRDSAVWHTERALELEPRMSEVMNNFAWMLAHGESPDLQRALTFIDAALAKNPNDLRMRDTKGVILMKMQRWDDALTEFESILPMAGASNRPAMHQKLAEIYSALGRKALADLHRAEAGPMAQPVR